MMSLRPLAWSLGVALIFSRMAFASSERSLAQTRLARLEPMAAPISQLLLVSLQPAPEGADTADDQESPAAPTPDTQPGSGPADGQRAPPREGTTPSPPRGTRSFSAPERTRGGPGQQGPGSGFRRSRGSRGRPPNRNDRSMRSPQEENAPRDAGATGSGSTNAPATGRDWAAFRIIRERNIFDANRSPRRRRPEGESPRPRRTETLTLVGTLSSEKGTYAFFDGSKPEFRTVLQTGKSLAGCRVSEIRPNSVQVETGTNRFELFVGMQLRQEDQQWRVVESSRPAALSPTTNSAASGTASSAEESEILKRLMEQREQDLK